jgi:hypothetical protein
MISLLAGSRVDVDEQPFSPVGGNFVSRLVLTASKDAKHKSELKKLMNC